MVAAEQHLYQTIVLPRKLTTGSIYDYLFCYCLLVGILFEVLRIIVQRAFILVFNAFNYTTFKEKLSARPVQEKSKKETNDIDISQ